MEQGGDSFARPSDGVGSSAQGRPPLVSQKIGSPFHQWNSASSKSLGSRYVGKVLIDCKFRFAESQWGVLGTAPQTMPAGVIYVDLSFNQPKKYRLSSASVQISLEEYKKPDKRKTDTKAVKATTTDQLSITDWFGPKMLTGKPTTRSGKVNYNFTPQIGAMGITVGGVGFNGEKTLTYSSQWVVSGYPVAGDRDGVHGAPYKTLRWELAENDFCAQPEHNNIIYTGLAFTHEAKPFCIKVKIEGKLRKVSDRLRFLFPPKRHRDQGTTVTLVNLGPSYRTGPPLDWLSRNLEEAMAQRNLCAVPPEMPDSLPLSLGDSKTTPDIPEAPEMTNRPYETAPEPESKDQSTFSPNGMASSSIVGKLSEALSDFVPSEKSSTTKVSASSFVAELPKDLSQSADTLKKEAEMLEDKARRILEYPTLLVVLHIIMVISDLFNPRRARPKKPAEQLKAKEKSDPSR